MPKVLKRAQQRPFDPEIRNARAPKIMKFMEFEFMGQEIGKVPNAFTLTLVSYN